jgi:hypothetical protein
MLFFLSFPAQKRKWSVRGNTSSLPPSLLLFSLLLSVTQKKGDLGPYFPGTCIHQVSNPFLCLLGTQKDYFRPYFPGTCIHQVSIPFLRFVETGISSSPRERSYRHLLSTGARSVASSSRGSRWAFLSEAQGAVIDFACQS